MIYLMYTLDLDIKQSSRIDSNLRSFLNILRQSDFVRIFDAHPLYRH